MLGERQVKTETGRVQREPREGRGQGKARLEGRIIGGREVHGVAGVVFAVARCGDEAKDSVERTPRREVTANDFRLPGDAAKTGDRDERYGVSLGGAFEPRPSGGGGWAQLDRASVVSVRDGDETSARGLRLKSEAATLRVIGG